MGLIADTLSMQYVLRQGVRKLQVSRIDLPPEATNRVFGDVMLEMELLQMGSQLSGTLAYNTGLFKESTAERVASQFQVCLSFSISYASSGLFHLDWPVKCCPPGCAGRKSS